MHKGVEFVYKGARVQADTERDIKSRGGEAAEKVKELTIGNALLG